MVNLFTASACGVSAVKIIGIPKPKAVLHSSTDWCAMATSGLFFSKSLENSIMRSALSCNLDVNVEGLYFPTTSGFSHKSFASGNVSGCSRVVKMNSWPCFLSCLPMAEPYLVCLPVHASYQTRISGKPFVFQPGMLHVSSRIAQES